MLGTRLVNYVEIFFFLKGVYEKAYVQHVLAVPSVDLNEVLHGNRPDVTEVQLRYSNIKEFEKYAKAVKIMYDLRVSIISYCSLIPRPIPFHFLHAIGGVLLVQDWSLAVYSLI